MSAPTLISIVVLLALLVYLYKVHEFFRTQKKICDTYPFYRLRDRVVWSIAQQGEVTPEYERIYRLLNRIVHHTDRLGWRFISEVAQEVVHAVLEGRQAGEQPTPLEIDLVKLVVGSARSNSLLVRLALTRFGPIFLMYPILKACYLHFRARNPTGHSVFVERVETVRRVRRLNRWSHVATAGP